MNYTFNLGAVPVDVEYRNIKILRLTVYPPDGRVGIAAPTGTAPEKIKEFALSKIRWIEKHRERFLSHSKLSGPLRNNAAVYVWGRAYRLELAEGRGNSKITFDGDCMILRMRPGTTKTKRQEFLDKWYRKILKEAAPGIIKKWEAPLGVEVKKLYVRKMKSHWGSCNCGKQTMRLNSELAKRSPECLEYVIVHEMLHLIEKGHNRNFYRLLGQQLPDWKEIRKKMNSGGI